MVSEPSGDETVNAFLRAWRYFKRQLPKVAEVKGPFFGMLGVAVLLAGGAGWLIPRMALYLPEIERLEHQAESLKDTIEGHKGTIERQKTEISQRDRMLRERDGWLEQYREELRAKTDPEALASLKALQKEVRQLEEQTAAVLNFAEPEWKKDEDGGFTVLGNFEVGAATPRSGLTFGITSAAFESFKITKIVGGLPYCAEYLNPESHVNLGIFRVHCRYASGRYYFQIKLRHAASIVIRYAFEQKPDGPDVTWQVPKS